MSYQQQKLKIIGGGQFDKDQMKHGYWIECYFDSFLNLNIMQSKGEYNFGKKVGNWSIFSFLDQITKIGGGQYDENGIKQGQWLELHQFFDSDCLIDFGEYKDGIKIGRWDTLQLCKTPQNLKIIGGGFFDQKSKKYGEWIDVQKDNELYSDILTICKGEYKNGKKFGKWEIKKRLNKHQKFQPICGGLFDMDGLKQGLWLEQYCQPFYYSQIQLIFFGEYKNGLKIDQWDYMIIDEDGSSFIIKDGGIFDENGMKQGLWNLYTNRSYQNNTYKVQYNKGTRINLWKENMQKIAWL